MSNAAIDKMSIVRGRARFNFTLRPAITSRCRREPWPRYNEKRRAHDRLTMKHSQSYKQLSQLPSPNHIDIDSQSSWSIKHPLNNWPRTFTPARKPLVCSANRKITPKDLSIALSLPLYCQPMPRSQFLLHSRASMRQQRGFSS